MKVYSTIIKTTHCIVMGEAIAKYVLRAEFDAFKISMKVNRGLWPGGGE